MYGCLIKHITPAIRTVCIRDTGAHVCTHWTMRETEEAVNLLNIFLGVAGIRLDLLILSRRSIELMEASIGNPWTLSALCTDVTTMLDKLASGYQRLILDKFALEVLNKRGQPLIEFRIPAVVVMAGQVDAMDVVKLLEQHLHCEGLPLDVHCMAQAFATRIDSERKARKVMEILRDYQAGDPRPSACYRNHVWTLGNVAGVNVDQLNRFCLSALWRFMQNWGPESAQDDIAQLYHSMMPSNEPNGNESSNCQSEDVVEE
ncbi:uncharacterized protein LOC129599173 [Paramacrobiotus metropolitanus]|uniref:uncharacterized protein LOC129599173 n=1 Tax=Paramacrobiotus metropolitanus TaxID=2943436 RepID=UPI00244617BD|nr:uncharacterized protein LOC129599173 [Paramacrobiotus metropolitanus]